MEELEYLIRTLTYKRSCLELDLKKEPNNAFIDGKIEGLNIAITEIYKLVNEKYNVNG